MIGSSRIVPAGHAATCRFRSNAELDTDRCPRCTALRKLMIQIHQRARRRDS